jgi:hypothetical protein
MATDNWTNKAGGDFADPTNWSKNAVPGAGDTAHLIKTTAPITSAADETVGTLNNSGADEEFDITGGTFTTTGFSNAGYIDVTGGSLFLGGGANATTNSAIIESGGGGVTIDDTTLTQTATAIIEAIGAGSMVTLTSATIVGGNLTTSAGGLIETGDSLSVLDGSTVAGAVTNGGTLRVNDGNDLTLDGSIVNSGIVGVNGTATLTGLLVGPTAVYLSGAGQVLLAADGYIAGTAAGATLTNIDNTITGGGFIKGPLNLTNDAAGVIDANNGRMVINTGATVVNAGRIDSAATGLLLVRNTTIDSSSGGSVVTGGNTQLDGATLLGGTVTVDAGGTLKVLIHSSAIGGGAAFGNAGQVQIGNGVNLDTGGTFVNSGTVTVAGAANFSGLVADTSGLTLGGGGVVVLDAKGYIGGLAAGASLTNIDNTIEGGGFIKGPLVLTNEAAGIIDADFGRMVLNTANSVINDGLVESTASGLLLVRNTTIDSSGGGTVTDARRMQLDNSTLEGTTFGVGKGAILQSVFHAATVNMMGGTVLNSGTIIGGSGGGLTIDGDVANLGLVEEVNGNLTVVGSVSGAGTTRLFGTGVLEVTGALTENVNFAAASTGQLALDDTAGFTGRVFGFSKTGKNSIDMKDVTFDAGDTFSYSGSAAGGTLTISNSDSVVVASLKFAGDYRNATWAVSADSGTGTVLIDPTATKTSSLTSAMASFGTSSGHSAAPATVLTQAPRLLAFAHA